MGIGCFREKVYLCKEKRIKCHGKFGGNVITGFADWRGCKGVQPRNALGLAVCDKYECVGVLDRKGRDGKDNISAKTEGADTETNGGAGSNGCGGDKRTGADDSFVFPVAVWPCRAGNAVGGEEIQDEQGEEESYQDIRFIGD